MTAAQPHLVQCIRLLAGLETATTQSARISVLKLARIVFDHEDTPLHDQEVEAGAVNILCKHLHRAVENDGDEREATRICKLLVMLFLCSEDVAVTSYCKLAHKLLPSIIKLASFGVSSTSETTRSVGKLVQRLSAINVPLASIENHKAIMNLLLRQIQRYSVDDSALTVATYALSLLTGLTSHKNSKGIAMAFPGLFQAVVKVVKTNPSIDCSYHSVRLLHNLAWHAENRAKIGQTKKCLDSLVFLSESTDQNVRAETLHALHHLSAEAYNKELLLSNAGGKLLGSLIDAITNSGDDLLRLQALQVLSNLISRESSKHIVSHSGLVGSLSDTACGKGPSSVVALAAQAVKRLATYVQVRDPCHDDLIKAMVLMSGCERKVVLFWTAKAFLGQSALSGSSFYIARTADALNSVVRLATCSHAEVKCSALEALANLTGDAANAKRIASNTSVLAALIRAVEDHSDEDESLPQRHAVRAILSLASHRSSMKRMAKHFGLVASLSRYGNSQDKDVELRRAALHGVLLLAPML